MLSLDIDDQLVEQLEAAAKSRGVTVRDYVQDVLRRSLSQPIPGRTVKYKLPAHDFGVHLENPWSALADMESEEYASKKGRK